MVARRLAAELLGTAGLLLAIVGSGVAAASDEGTWRSCSLTRSSSVPRWGR